jgi:hypothetical protein
MDQICRLGDRFRSVHLALPRPSTILLSLQYMDPFGIGSFQAGICPLRFVSVSFYDLSAQ